MKYVDRPELGEHATFVPNKKLPVYNWFYYKEGFSRDIVFHLIERFQIGKGNTVLDPFAGSGTTLLACKEKGIDSIGFDASELAVFASNVKIGNYDLENLREEAKFIFTRKFFRLDTSNAPSIAKRAFSKFALEDIQFFRGNIAEIENKNFFLLGLVNAAMKVSYVWKDGGVIKFKKHPAPPLRHLYRRIIKNMIKSLEKKMPETSIDTKNISSRAFVGDARMLKLENESIDAIITSPPYLNNIDYTKVYAIEEWIAGLEDRPAIRSWIGHTKSDITADGRPMTSVGTAYFEDIKKALEEMFRVLKKGGKAAIIVGNAYVNGEIINSDEVLAKQAEKIGFTTKEIDVVNKRFALEERTKKKGILRESMIILEKN
ncbi:MAG: hypothetical protein HY513_00830 [Candidatus Aenigmarchaeota archaeon]|nr:hypothetical protein [Candidatus Aenigmarchaeota archaeon]